MKRIGIMLLLLLSLCACALAEESIGPAATAVRASLYDMPKQDAAELMRYFVGVRVEVVREVDAEYVQVNVGEQGGSLMGYMRKADLAFGEAEIRRVRAENATYSAGGAQCRLYSYCDARSPVIRSDYDIDCKSVLGVRGDAWLHVEDEVGVTGFVSLEEIEVAGPEVSYAIFARVQPAPNEPTFEEAIAHAREKIAADAEAGRYQDGPIQADVLAACEGRVTAYYFYDTPDRVMYSVLFLTPDTGMVYAGIDLMVEGAQIVEESYGNG